MDTLPLDVWHHIFFFACADGGHTGARLARTSRAFLSSSATYRFHSVELHGVGQLRRFLSAYDTALATASVSSAPTDPPRVRHLTFAFLPPKVDMIILDGPIHFRDFHSWQQAKIVWNTEFVSGVARLFALVASHLVTLTVLQSPDVPLPFVSCGQPFPALRSLTLVTDDSFLVHAPSKGRPWMEPTDSSHFGAGAPPTCTELVAAPPFPALEELHLADGKWQHTLPLWAAAAPRVAQLRITGVDEESVAALRDLLRTAPPDFKFGALRGVVLHPKFDADAAKAQGENENMMVALQDIRVRRLALSLEIGRVLEPEGLAYDLKRRKWTVGPFAE
ncbi:hypothetical protein GSI_03799 [Ganoderma sinense ZZ0214-1]|uniref:F-box domain-containing protein n=1 Tax=Ganoderma sinense ZZ0214-1 TaxID=1077348 RepID=A0A2G8SKJ6_9APHY|nr:hypothetical protein GSI_03799 [Ganoderma sinense ZZ0214-1]